MKNTFRNKLLSVAMIVIIVAAMLTMLTACINMGGGNENDDKVPVTFENIVFKDGDTVIETDGHPKPGDFVPTKEGYTFRGWVTDPNDPQSVFDIEHYDGNAITLHALWKANQYKVTFVDHDGTILPVAGKDEQSVAYNTAAVAPSAPTRDGYTFVGWDKPYDQIRQDTVITAQYERKSTTVSFYFGNHLLSQSTVYIGDAIKDCESQAVNALAAYRAGLAFEGWYADEAFTQKIDVSKATATDNMNIYAHLTLAPIQNLTIQTQSPDNTFEYADDLVVDANAKFDDHSQITYTVQWFLDNNLCDGENNKTLALHDLSIGTHTLKVVVTSAYGTDRIDNETSIDIVVGKATVTVKVNDVTIHYGDPLPAFSYSFKNKNNNLLGEAVYSCDYQVGSPVGSYVVSIANLQSDLYDLQFESGTLFVVPKPITVKATDTAVEYGSDLPAFGYESEGLLSGDSLGEGTFATEYTKGSPVGDYTVSVEGLSNDNYEITGYQTGVLTVEKMDLTIRVICAGTIYYGAERPAFSYKITKGTLLDGDSLGTPTFKCDYQKGSGVGWYTVRLTGLSNANYNFQSVSTANFRVLPKEVTLQWNVQDTYTYNGLDQCKGISATFVDIRGNTVAASLAFDGKSTVFKDAGAYDVTASYADTNYTIANATMQTAIAKAAVTVTIDNAAVTYGDIAPNYTYSIDGVLQEDSLGDLSIVCDYVQGSPAGEYALRGEGLHNDNYDIHYTDAQLTVAKKRVDVQWAYNDSYVYNGAVQADTVKASIANYDGTTIGLPLTYSSNTGATEFRSAGVYTVTASAVDQNHELVGAQQTIAIAPKDVRIVLTAQEISYGDEKPAFDCKVEGLAEGDDAACLGTIAYICDYVQGANVGEYTIGGSGLQNSNYTITYDAAVLTVNKAVVTAVWDILDSYVYNGTAQNNAVSVGFVQYNGQYQPMDIAFACGNYTDFCHAGSYQVTATSEAENNYDILDTVKTLTIEQKQIEVIADPVSLQYGDDVPAFTHKVVGLVDGDSLGESRYVCTYTKGAPVNEYPIAVEGYQNADYQIVYTNAILTCTHRKVNVVWSMADSYTYNGADQSATVNATFVDYNGQTVQAAVAFVCGDNTQFKNAGEYALVATSSDANYSLINDTNSATIGKKAVTIDIANVSATFGDETVVLDCMVNGVVDGEDLGTNVAFDYAQGVTAAGSYSLTADYTANDNYDVVVNAGTLTVGKRTVTVEWTIGNYTYNGTDQGADVKAVYTAYDGTQVSMPVTFAGADTAFRNAGNYTLTVSGDNDNYDYENTTQSAVIAKKELIVSADNKSIQYGDSVEYTYTQVGLVDGDSLGDWAFDCAYAVGSTVGNYDITIVGVVGDNYAITVNNAVLTVEPKRVAPVWEHLDEYIYNGADRADTVRCYYTDIAGEVVDMPLAINGNDTAFKNAGTYTFTATNPDSNYTIAGQATLDLVINKASYQNITHADLTGTYDPAKTLADYALAADYAWVDATIVPTVDVTTYHAVYNADAVNYNDYPLTITLTLAKADYTNVPAHNALSGVYSGQSLSAYALNDNYRWSDPTEIPVVSKTTYAAYYNSDSVNYNDYAVSITLALQKGTYTGITHKSLSGVYSPSKTLAAYALDSGFAWKTPDTVPTCDVTAYTATYNADPANYNTLELSVTVTLTKATVSLQQKTWSFDYDGNAKTINATVMYNGAAVAASNYTLTYSDGNSFTDGGVYTTTVQLSATNYQLPSSAAVCTVSIKSVITSASSTLTTLEDALNNTTSGTVIVKYNTRLYGEATVKSGVTLLVPYDANHDATTNLTVASGGAPGSAYVTLHIMGNALLTVNGTLNVAGRQVTTGAGAGGHTSGSYGCMVVEAGGFVDVYGKLYSFGFILGSGDVYLNSGAEGTEPLQIKDWPGGSIAYTVCNEFFPFSQFLVSNIEANLTVAYGAKLNAHYSITASDKEFPGDLLMFGSGGLFEITDNQGYFTKMLNPATGKVAITAYGKVKTNNVQISIKLSIFSVDMKTEGKEIPIPGYYDIVLEKGSNVTIGSKFKFLPGSSLTIKQGATCTVTSSGGLIGYDSAYTNVYTNYGAQAYGGATSAKSTRLGKQVYQSNSPVSMVVDGTLTCSGAIGGTFTTTVVGSKLNLSGASSVSGTIISYYNMTSEKQTLSIKLKNTKYTYAYAAKSNGQNLSKTNYTGKANGYFV